MCDGDEGGGGEGGGGGKKQIFALHRADLLAAQTKLTHQPTPSEEKKRKKKTFARPMQASAKLPGRNFSSFPAPDFVIAPSFLSSSSLEEQ